MHRLLTIHELVLRIGSYLDFHSAYAATRVSKLWSEIALDILWEEVDFRIFKAISVVQLRGYIMSFVVISFIFVCILYTEAAQDLNPDHVDPGKWRSFRLNCRRTVRLGNIPAVGYYGLDRASQEIVLTLLRGDHLFPALRSIVISNDCLTPLCMGPSVSSFTWAFGSPNLDLPDFKRSINDISSLMPNLINVCLIAGPLHGKCDREFATLFSRLPGLSTIIFTAYTLSPAIYHALSMLPVLARIQLTPPGLFPRRFHGDREMTQSWRGSSFDLASPGFISLCELHLCLPELSDARAILRHNNLPLLQLRSVDFVIAFPGTVQSLDLTQFFHDLATECPNVVALSLTLTKRCRGAFDLDGVNTLNFADLHPLFRLSLTHFTIRHTLPVMISDSEAEVLAETWQGLEVLNLNRHPIVLSPSGLSYMAFTSFAKWCPRMKSLGLYINAYQPYAAPLGVSFGHDLQELHVGASLFPIEGAEELWTYIAEFFAELLPLHSALITSFVQETFDSDLFMGGAPLRRVSVAVPTRLMQRNAQCWIAVGLMVRRFRQWKERGLLA